MNRMTKVNGRGVSRTIAESNDKMGGTTEATPGDAPTSTEGLTTRTPNKEVDVMAVRQRTVNSRQQIALDYLALSQREFEQATANRIRYMQLCREYGITNAAIGAAVGLTESTVRGLVTRHAEPECVHCGDDVDPGQMCPECGLYDGSDA